MPKTASKPRKYPPGVVPGEPVTAAQLAQILKVGRSTIQDRLRAGRIEHFTVPGIDPTSKHKLRRIPWEVVLKLQETEKSKGGE